MIASFNADYGDANIYVDLTCTEDQAQTMYDIYQRGKNATLLIAAVFEGLQSTTQPNSTPDSESDSDHRKSYSAVGTLIAWKVAEHVARPKNTPAEQEGD